MRKYSISKALKEEHPFSKEKKKKTPREEDLALPPEDRTSRGLTSRQGREGVDEPGHVLPHHLAPRVQQLEHAPLWREASEEEKRGS